MIGEPYYTAGDGTRYPVSRMPVPFAARVLAKHGATLAPDVRAALEVRAALAGTVADAGPCRTASGCYGTAAGSPRVPARDERPALVLCFRCGAECRGACAESETCADCRRAEVLP